MKKNFTLNSVQIEMLQFLRNGNSSKENPLDLKTAFDLGKKGGNTKNHRNYLEISEHGTRDGDEINQFGYIVTNEDGLCWITEKGKEALNILSRQLRENLELID